MHLFLLEEKRGREGGGGNNSTDQIEKWEEFSFFFFVSASLSNDNNLAELTKCQVGVVQISVGHQYVILLT